MFHLVFVSFPRKVVGNNMGSFQQNKGADGQRRGLFLQNKAKTDDILRQPTRANTKMRAEPPFLPTERVFLHLFRGLRYTILHIRVQEGAFGAYGLSEKASIDGGCLCTLGASLATCSRDGGEMNNKGVVR